jgi:pimeloyl-ACP methyl ester carboxylesterase
MRPFANVTRIGTGPPVLFVNGLYQRRQAWEPIAKGLESKFEIILFDFPNQSLDQNGGVADPAFDGPELFEDYILELLAALALSPNEVSACGLSFGASLLRSLHLRRSIDFKQLILIGLFCPELVPFHKQFHRSFLKLLEEHGVERYAELITFWVFSHKWISKNPFSRYLVSSRFKAMFPDEESIRALQRATTADHERGVPPGPFRCPTVVVNGSEDIISPPRYMRPYAERSGAVFSTVDGGHVFTAENLDGSGMLLRHVLAECNPVPAETALTSALLEKPAG